MEIVGGENARAAPSQTTSRFSFSFLAIPVLPAATGDVIGGLIQHGRPLGLGMECTSVEQGIAGIPHYTRSYVRSAVCTY